MWGTSARVSRPRATRQQPLAGGRPLSFRGSWRHYSNKHAQKGGRVAVEATGAVGIDLGTSTSAVAVLRTAGGDGRPYIVPDGDNRALIPSVVYFKKDGGVLVGHEALAASRTDPANAYGSVKRLLGKTMAQVREVLPALSYGVAEGPDGLARVVRPAEAGGAGQPSQLLVAPEEVCGHLLAHLLDKARRHLGEDVTEAVITIPSRFTAQQAAATVRAGQLAGLQRVSLLQEPVAAAMAYGFGRSQEDSDTLLVVDLGGGTFDVSILDGFEGILEVLSSAGDPHLGGDDFTWAVADWAAVQLELPAGPHGLSLEVRNQLFAAAEAAKIELSTADAARLAVSGGGHPQLLLSRQQLDQLAQPLRQRMWPPLQRVAEESRTEYTGRAAHAAGAAATAATAAAAAASTSTSRDTSLPQQSKYAPPPRKLTGVVLVGAATRMPLVRDYVRQLTGLPPAEGLDPEECVALGAAVHAGLLQGMVSGLELMDGGYVLEQHGRTTGI